MNIHASVVVPTFNRCGSVLRLLKALEQQTFAAQQFEVVVSVDGSTDDTVTAVNRLGTSYKLVCLAAPNRGRAAACNAGIRAATGEIVILLDDDMEPAPHFMAAHVASHAAGEAAGVMGAVPVVLNENTGPAARYIGEKFNAHLRSLETKGRELHFRDFYSGNFSIPRQVMLAAGAFDEDFSAYGNEDLELSWRLRRMGVRFTYNPDAVARQFYLKNFQGLARDNVEKGRTAVLLASKHPDTIPHLRLAGYRQGRVLSRSFRYTLLRVTAWWPTTTRGVVAAMAFLERRQSAVFKLCCAPVLDYLFWVGAISAGHSPEASSCARR